MDYEQKYNKLVNAIKVLQKTNPSDEGIQNWVNDNVPELRESEDERIRKGLIEFFEDWKETKSHLWGMNVNDILAWLEKQGQVKESEISQPIKETSKENDNSLTNKAWSEIQNGIILDGVVYELTTGFPEKTSNDYEAYQVRCHADSRRGLHGTERWRRRSIVQRHQGNRRPTGHRKGKEPDQSHERAQV